MGIIDAIVLVGYLLGITALGIWMARRVHNSSDFFMPRRFGKATMIMHAFGSGTASDQAVAVVSGTFKYGVAGGAFKFTVTSPYMLARTLLDNHYRDLEKLTFSIADVLAGQVTDLPCACLQVDEANVPGHPEHSDIASAAINRVLEAFPHEKAVHLCFGNYGGQVIQSGTWTKLIAFLNSLKVDHLVLELAHRPVDDLAALKEIDTHIALGIGVIDIKVNPVESPEEVARRIETAEERLGAGRVRFIHPDCGFWMLKRSIADRKMEALVNGRNLYLGI